MRVACLGGGPAGLLAAILLKLGDPASDVTVFERREPGEESYGFGVVLSPGALTRLRSLSPELEAEVSSAGVSWQGLVAHVHGRELSSSGHDYFAISRETLLSILHRHASKLGARITMAAQVSADSLHAEYDLVLVAEGAGSRTRGKFADELGVTSRTLPGRFAWFGAPIALRSMHFIFEATPFGDVGVHAYPYSADKSTFIVEINETVLERWADTTGIALDDEHGWAAACSGLFSQHLDGAELIPKKSKWTAFTEVSLSRWHLDNTVFIGDAAHTAHFSLGQGTTLAFDDAAELVSCLSTEPDVPTALGRFATMRSRRVADLQDRAWVSADLWVGHPSAIGTGPDSLLRLLSRTGDLNRKVLFRLDPNLATALTVEPADPQNANWSAVSLTDHDPSQTPVTQPLALVQPTSRQLVPAATDWVVDRENRFEVGAVDGEQLTAYALRCTENSNPVRQGLLIELPFRYQRGLDVNLVVRAVMSRKPEILVLKGVGVPQANPLLNQLHLAQRACAISDTQIILWNTPALLDDAWIHVLAGRAHAVLLTGKP